MYFYFYFWPLINDRLNLHTNSYNISATQQRFLRTRELKVPVDKRHIQIA